MNRQAPENTRYFEKILTQRLAEKLNFLQVLIGPRQVGKTTAVTRIFDSWSGPKKMISADLPTPPDHTWLTAHWNDAATRGDDVLFVVDEVHKVTGWNEVIKALFDRVRSARQMRVVLLGSASLTIQRGLGESLAGRYELLKANHWSFGECVRAFGLSFEEFLRFGGYPAALELRTEPERWRAYVRDSIIEPVLGRDLLGHSRVNKPALFRQLFEIAMQYPAQVVSYNKLLGQLQERGNTDTIKDYLQLLEGGFLLKQLHKYSRGVISTKTSSPKILPMDLALVAALSRSRGQESDPAWRGRLIESAFGAHLARQGGELYYWADGRFDVDFVHEHDGILTAYEVKSGRERDGKGLMAFAARYPEAVTRLVTDSEIEEILRAGSSGG
jgi:predicted AAA+ superfamily ATPase